MNSVDIISHCSIMNNIYLKRDCRSSHLELKIRINIVCNKVFFPFFHKMVQDQPGDFYGRPDEINFIYMFSNIILFVVMC